MSHKQPFVLIIIFLISGIIIENYLGCSKSIIFGITIAIALSYLIVALLLKPRYNNSIFGFLISLAFVVLGIHITEGKKQFKPQESNNEVYIAKLENVPKPLGGVYKCILNVEAKQQFGYWISQEIRIEAYFEKGILIDSVKAGQLIIFSAEVKDIKSAKNPFDFDYKDYMNKKGINSSAYISKNSWKVLSIDARGIQELALNLRQKLINSFQESGIVGEQLAVFSALTLGYKDKLDSKIKDAYSGAGAMHVLAVSGLHVGIIFLVLEIILIKGLFKRRKKQFAYALIILGIWFYALLTGLSTSVTRSAIMFSFILFGKVLDRKISVYNSLAASAFILLIINSNFLFDVGFQLSYSAVAGISFLQPKIVRWFYFKNWFVSYTWQLTAVSLAAQISTFPITLYYFKQFPTYFWLSNIIVILAATAFIMGSILMVFFSFSDTISKHLGVIFNFLVEQVNGFVYWINSLPYSQMHNININSYQLLLLYVIIITLSFWLLYKKYNYLVSLISVLIIFKFSLIQNSIKVNKNRALAIYHIPKNSAVHLISNTGNYWLVGNENRMKSNFISKANNYWQSNMNYSLHEIQNQYIDSTSYLFKQAYFIQAFDYRGLIIDENTKPAFLSNNKEINVDFILVTGNTLFGIKDLPKSIKYNHLIVDGSVPPWKVNLWKDPLNDKVFLTREKGAFILKD